MPYLNPYSDSNFFQFFVTFIQRLFFFLTGQLGIQDLVSDEIQILVLLGISVSGALVGTFLVLRKMTMLANSLSHTILLGIVLAYVLMRPKGMMLDHDPIDLKAMLIASFATGIVTTYLTEMITKVLRLQEDASIGLVFTSLFALGIVLVTVLSKSAHIGTEVIMGNVNALHLSDLGLVWLIVSINIGLILLFYKEYQISTFDPGLSSALGISPLFFQYLLMTQVSLTVVAGFRAVGVLMILAFMTAPPLAARFLVDRLKQVFWVSIGLGAGSALFGVAISRHLLTVYGIALSTSGVVVCLMGVFFGLSLLGRYFRKLFQVA